MRLSWRSRRIFKNASLYLEVWGKWYWVFKAKN